MLKPKNGDGLLVRDGAYVSTRHAGMIDQREELKEFRQQVVEYRERVRVMQLAIDRLQRQLRRR